MTELDIIKMYKEGLSVDYITKSYYKYKNKTQGNKPIFIDGFYVVPKKIYTKEYCRTHVSEIIYKNLLAEHRRISCGVVRICPHVSYVCLSVDFAILF